MASAKDLLIKPISSKDANSLIKKLHYSGKVVQNSQLHLGVFWQGRLAGAMQFGPSLDKRKVQGLVSNTPWNGFIELNRMAFSDVLPRNSESRAISVAMKILKKQYPHFQWVLSFSDGSLCGDGTIYRASGFVLTSIKPNKQMLLWKGKIFAKSTLDSPNYPRIKGKYFSRYLIEQGEAKPIPGFQLRYIYFIDPKARNRLTVPILPFSKIQEIGASMYKGSKIKERLKQDHVSTPDKIGGAAPTQTLQLKGSGSI